LAVNWINLPVDADERLDDRVVWVAGAHLAMNWINLPLTPK
jgi:hypothetical protein